MENENSIESKGIWRQLQEARLKGEVKEYKPMFTLDQLTEIMQQGWEQNKRHREDTLKYWPDIGLWPDDLPEGVYQGSIGGVRGMYSTKFRDLLKEAAKKEYEKSSTTENRNPTEKE